MSNNNYYVYKHTNKLNGKIYIGITLQKPEQRWANGRGYRTQYFSRAISKYGWDGFSHEILYEGLSETQAKILETSLIYYYKSTNPKYGYNVSEGGYVVSEKTRKKISEAHKGKVFSEEHKAKISKAHKGKTGFKNPHSKSCICLTTGFAFGSTHEAGRYYNTNHSHIGDCCNGKRKSAGKLNDEKLVWKYIRDLPKPKLTKSDKQHLRDIRDRFYNN